MENLENNLFELNDNVRDIIQLVSDALMKIDGKNYFNSEVAAALNILATSILLQKE